MVRVRAERAEGAPRESPFPAEEFARRQQAVRDRARAQGFDALLIADPANLYYLTGYDAWSFYQPQVLHLPADGDPTLLMREMDARGAWRTAVGIDADDILGYPETYIHQPDTHPGQWMARMLRERGHGSAARVGYEGEAHFFTVRTYRAFADTLPEWTLDDCQDLVNWVRLVKSDGEIELMRAAGEVCSAVMSTAIESVHAGRPQNLFIADVMAAQARGTDRFDGDYPAIVPMLPTDTPHLTWTDDPIPAGEPISIELAGVHHRYHAPLARTVLIGSAPAELDRLAGVTVEGLEAALGQVRAGVTADAVSRAFTAVIASAGYTKASRLGYSIGVGYPPDWGERTVSIRAGEQIELVENMTFHLMAGMWMTGFGFEVSESIRVTGSGVEILTNAPRALILIDERSPL